MTHSKLAGSRGARRALLAFASFAALAAGHAHAQENRWQSVWHEGQETSLHTGLLSLEDFTSNAAALLAEGLRLVDVETARVNGDRAFAGLWRPGTGGNFLDVVAGRAGLRQAMRQRAADGLRLTDIELFRQGGQRRFAAVFGPGTGRQMVTRPLRFRDFLERKELLRSQGLFLHDIELVVVNGGLRLVGLYRSDTPETVLTGARQRQAFNDLRDRLVGRGWELIDMERIDNASGDPVFFGLWREGDGISRISLPRRFPRHFVFAQEQIDAGRHAVDFEIVSRAAEVVPPEPEPEGPIPPLKTNPAHIELGASNSMTFTLEFTQLDDTPFTLEIPRLWLPDWLPEQNGAVLLPDLPCGFNIQNADSVTWFDNGVILDEAPFRTVPEVPNEFNLPGIEFQGAFGTCAGPNANWSFQDLFFPGPGPAEPFPNLSLQIQTPNGALRFKAEDAAYEQILPPEELFSDETMATLEDVLDHFHARQQAGQSTDAYCETVGQFWEQVCTSPGGDCPANFDAMPSC